MGNITLPDHMKCPANTVDSLIGCIYPGVSVLPHPPDHYFHEHAILSACNDDVHDMNAAILRTFPGEEHILHSADSAVVEDEGDGAQALYPVEYCNSINASGIPLAKLALKVGCPVIIMRNLNPSQGVCNGTRAILTKLTHHILEV